MDFGKPTKDTVYVPCLFIRYKSYAAKSEDTAEKPPSKIVVLFHSNAEDVHQCFFQFSLVMSTQLQCDVLVVEYPSYGGYTQEQPSADKLTENAHLVIWYLTSVLGYEQRDIILVGRSMGTGVVCQLAAHYPQLAAAILISPFTSIKAATR